MVLACFVNGFFVLFLACATIYWVGQRRRDLKSQQPAGDLIVSRISGLVIGAALLGFQAIVQPEVRHRIVEEQKEECTDDLSGDGPPGGRLLHQQLRQIRNGEEPEELTVRINP
jgi:hypothetical protein